MLKKINHYYDFVIYFDPVNLSGFIYGFDRLTETPPEKIIKKAHGLQCEFERDTYVFSHYSTASDELLSLSAGFIPWN